MIGTFLKRRRAFTLLETVIALTIAVVVVSLAASAVLLSSRSKRESLSAGRMQGAAMNADEVFRRSLEQAGQRMFATYNVSGINSITAGPPDAARDTLITLSARGRAIANSTKSCTSLPAASCMVLIGDVTGELAVGDVVLTGNPQAGGRILQIADMQGPIALSCGSDCGEEDLQITRNETVEVLDSVVVSHTIAWKDGTETIEAGGCPALSSNPQWASCTENKELRSIGTTATITAGTSGGSNWNYTEVAYVDRTEDPFRYPSASTWTARSGASGTPGVYTQQIRFGIFYLDDRDPSSPTLVRRSTLAPNGQLGPEEPLARNIGSFRVETQHRGDVSLVRGVGLTPGDLARNSGNPNYSETSTASEGSDTRASEFIRSYMSIASVKLSYEVMDPRTSGFDPGSRSRDVRPMAVQVATPHLLDGGVIDTRVSESSYLSSNIADGDVRNAPPIARMRVAPNPTVVGQTVAFSDDGSTDPDGTIANYAWDFGDGNAGPSGPGASSADHTYSAPGTYFASLTVTDNLGLTGTHTVQVLVESTNLSPTAEFTLPANPVTGVWLAFTDASSDPDGTIASRIWTTDDGQTARGEVASFMWSTPGVKSVTLTVTDDRGATATETKSITVGTGNTPPVAVIDPPACAATVCQEGESTNWSAASSYDPDGRIVRLEWDWGDGTSGSVGESVSHSFVGGGTHTVRLTAIDNDGASGSATFDVMLNAAPVADLVMPACAATTEGCLVGTTYTFNSSASYDPDGSIASRLIDFGDGTTASTPVATHTYSAAGDYQVHLTVTDNLGNATLLTRTMRVLDDQRPVVTCPATFHIPQGNEEVMTCSVRNPSAEPRNYSFTAESSDRSVVSVLNPASRSIGAGETQNIPVTLRTNVTRAGGAVVTLRATDGRQTGVAQTNIGVTGTYGVGLSALAGSASARNLVVSGAGGSVQFGSQAFGPVVADGITVIVFNKATGSHVASTDFATGSSGADAAALADYLDNLPSNAYVAIVGSGSWDGALTDDARNAFYRLGLGQVQYPSGGGAYTALVDSDDVSRSRESLGSDLRALASGNQLYSASHVAPNGLAQFAVVVTNLSTQAGSIELTSACSGDVASCAVVDEAGVPVIETRTLEPDSSQIVYVQYRAEASGSGTAGLRGDFGDATNTLTWPFVVGDLSRAPPAIVSGPGDFGDAPGRDGRRHVTIENTWSRGRSFTLTPLSSNSGVLDVSAGASVWVGAGGSVSVPLHYDVASQAAAGASSVYGLRVEDGVAGAVDATGTFTVSDAPVAPLVIPADDFSVSAGESGSVDFTVVSRTNTAQTYTVSTSQGGIVQTLTGPTSVAIGAYDSATVTLSYQISSNAQSSSTGTMVLTATYLDVMSGSGITTVTAEQSLAEPTVTAPGNRMAAPGASGTSNFTVRNNSNEQRTFTLSASRSGVIASVDMPTSITLNAGASQIVAVNWQMSNTAVADSTGSIQVSAADGALSDSDTQTFTASQLLRDPTVVGTGDIAAMPGASGNKAFQVTNNSNATRTLTFVAGRSGVTASASAPASVTFAPFETRNVPANFSINAGASAGQTGTLSLTAVDGSYSGSDTVNVSVSTTAGIAITNVTGLSFNPGVSRTFTASVSNTGNAPVTVEFVDAGPAGPGDATNGYNVRISGPAPITVPANTSVSVSFSGSVASGAVAGVTAGGAIEVRGTTDPSITATGVVEGYVAATLADPTVSAPSDFTADPGESGTAVFKVTNNSNSTRAFTLSVARSGPFSAGNVASSISIGQGQTRDVVVNWTVSSAAVAGETGTLELTAADGGYAGSATVEMTVNLVERSPQLTGTPGNHGVDPASSHDHTFSVTNRTNQTRPIWVYGTRTAQDSVVSDVTFPDGSDDTQATATYTFAPYETRTFTRRETVSATAPAGSSGQVRYAAQDQVNTALSNVHVHTVTTNLVEKNPTVSDNAADHTVVPGGSYSHSFTVTNNTNATRTFNVGNPSSLWSGVVTSLSDKGLVTFAPFQTRTFNYNYSIVSEVAAGETARIRWNAVDQTNTALTGYDEHTLTVATVLASPLITTSAADHSTVPGQSHTHSYTVKNRSNVARTLEVYGYDGNETPRALSDLADNRTNQAFAPYEERTYSFTWQSPSQSESGARTRAIVRARDSANPTTYVTHNIHWVTTSTVLANPTLSGTPANHGADPGSTHTHNVTVRNNSNAQRTIQVYLYDLNNGNDIVTGHSAAREVTLGPYASSSLTNFSETVSSSATGGQWEDMRFRAQDTGNTSYQSTYTHRVTTNTVLKDPTLDIFEPGTTTPVGAHSIVPGGSYTHDFRIRNNSNVARTFQLMNSGSGSSPVFTSDGDMLGIAIPAFGSVTVSRTHSARTQIVAGTTADIRWTAQDQASTGYAHARVHRVTVATVLKNPSLSGHPANHSANPGATTSHSVTVTNNSNTSRTFEVYLYDLGNANNIVSSHSGAQNVTIPAYGSTLVSGLSETTTSPATAGHYEDLTLRVRDTGNTSYVASDNHRVTIGAVDAHPTVTCTPSSTSVDHLSWGSSTCTVKNNGNTARTFTISTSRDGTRINNTSSSTASLSVGAYGSQNVTLNFYGANVGSGWARLTATYGSYTGYGQVNVTVNATDANPTVTCTPSSTTINHNSTGSATCTVKNNGGVTRTFSLTASRSGSITSATRSPTSVTLAGGASQNVTLGFTGGTTGSGWARLTATYGSYSGYGQVNVTVNPVLANPTVSAPGVQYVWRNQTYSGSWSVKNNSSVTRTLCFTASAGNYINSPGNPSCQSFSAGQTRSINVSYTIQNYNGDLSTHVRLRAYDQSSTGYAAQADRTVRIPKDPTVTVNKTRSDGPPGSTHSATWTLRHESQWPMSYCAEGSSGNTSVADRPATTCPLGVTLTAPGQTSSHTVSWTVKSNAPLYVTTTVGYHFWNQAWGTYSWQAYWDWNVGVQTTVTDNLANPTVSVPYPGPRYANQNYTDYWYVRNNHGMAATFNLSKQGGMCAGWFVGNIPSSVNLSAGQQTSVALTYMTGMAGSSCNLGITATDASRPAYSGSANTMVTVQAGEGCDLCVYDAGRSSMPAELLAAPALTCETDAVLEGQELFCGAQSQSDNVAYQHFDWGDGARSTVEGDDIGVSSHRFDGPGTYTVSAYVVGADGATSAHRSATIEVHENRPPEAPVIDMACSGGMCPVDMEIPLLVDAQDPDSERFGDAIKTFYVDLGDGRALWTEPGEPLSVRYDAPGTYTVSAVAYDDLGVASTVASVVVTAQEAPKATVACTVAEGARAGEETQVFVQFDSQVPLEQVHVSVDGGEGLGARLGGALSGTFQFMTEFGAAGEHTIECRVEDAIGRVETIRETLMIDVPRARRNQQSE